MLSYYDSPAYRHHPLFSTDRTALQIQLYYDDVEVVNPLGSNTKVHKLGMPLCMALCNLCLIYWCTLHFLFNCRLILLHSWELATKVQVTSRSYTAPTSGESPTHSNLWNGCSTFLCNRRSEDFGTGIYYARVRDPQQLLQYNFHFLNVISQEGLQIGDMMYKGALTVISADNLASQLIGGYKALNAAFRKCRFCMATDEQMQSKVIVFNHFVYTGIAILDFKYMHSCRYTCSTSELGPIVNLQPPYLACILSL